MARREARVRDMHGTVVPDSFDVRGHAFRGLEALPRGEAERLHGDLLRYGGACGCGAGSVGALLAGSSYLVGLPALPAVVAALAGGVVGRCLGLWWARRRFDAARRELESALRLRSASEVRHG